MRARIVPMAAKGMTEKDIALKLDTDRRVAARWHARFLAAGVDGDGHLGSGTASYIRLAANYPG